MFKKPSACDHAQEYEITRVRFFFILMTFCLWTVSAKQSVAALSTTHCPPRIDADSNKTKLRIITDYNKTKSGVYVLDQMLRLNWHKGSYPTMTGLHLLRHPEQSRHRRQCTLQWSNRADFKEEIHLWPEHIDCVNHWAENGSRNLIEWLKTWNARGNAPHFFLFSWKQNILHLRFMWKSFLRKAWCQSLQTNLSFLKGSSKLSL